ncbi:uncharacterized protein K02A2.6-like [Osmia bicornis bicornis]|uniref:uncharacterized protein K02A2.6-like n=1 Tax=Osmia bicornis bicornis TaxID=1437191 RepID=UPI001EAE857E|nr:uncharacterized protein K02A2.6-like [Osmia bicornis bicornis]
MENFKPPMGLDLRENAANNLKSFKQRFELFITAISEREIKEQRKVAMLLNCIGNDALDVFNMFALQTENLTTKLIFEKFEEYVKPRVNIIIERHKFHSRRQEEGEPFDSFLTDLRKLAKNCDFEQQEESLIRDRIVIAVNDEGLQQRLLRDPNLTVEKVIESCRAAEMSKIQQKSLKVENTKTKEVSVNVIKKQNYRQGQVRSKASQQKKKEDSQQSYDCKKCGSHHKRASCPAFGKVCKKCGRVNHFAIGCLSTTSRPRSVNEVATKSNQFFVDSVNTELKKRVWIQQIKIGNNVISFKVDTGADCNIIPWSIFKSLEFSKQPHWIPTITTVVSYINDKCKSLGTAILHCSVDNKRFKVKFIIVDVESMPILGLNTCVKLKLIKKDDIDIRVCNTITEEINMSKQEFVAANEKIFRGLGSYPYKYEIKLKEHAVPVVSPCRRVPFSIKDKLKSTLDSLERAGIIKKVNYATDWVNNMVIVEKPNKTLRICLDSIQLNKSIKPEKFPIPTADELCNRLAGKEVYSVLDMKDGFHQVQLTEKSSEVCTFITPFGKYKYTRLPFGLSTAPEVFQRVNTIIFGDIEGVGIYFDDLIIAAKNEKDHDKIMQLVLERANKCNVRFNKNKLQYKTNEVKYLGFIFNKDGVKPDRSHVEAILKIKQPTNKKELLRILGMINFLSKFIPNVSQLTSCLRELIKKDVDWQWGPEHSEALDKIKHKIVEAPTLKLFDNKLPIVIQADASQHGLGACLLQCGRPVLFASRSLTDTEHRYPQIEKECLAVCFAVEKFHQFVYGHQVKVYTDHKPLVSIIKKNIHKVTPRLQRLMLKLTKYTIDLEYLPGKQMLIADLLSRSHLNKVETEVANNADNEIVHSLNTYVAMSQSRVEEFQKATANDTKLKQIINYSLNGWPQAKCKSADTHYWLLRNEITYHKGILFLNDNKILVPELLQSEMIRLAHKPHFGIEKTKKRLKQLFYWPKLTQDVINHISGCRVCEKYGRNNIKEPLIPHKIPSLPFEKVAVDYFEYAGKNYIAIIDYYSKWLEIIKTKGKTSKETSEALKRIFSVQGIPKTVVCDNMPFNSFEFQKFAKQWGCDIITSSPLYPKSNGLAEKAVGIAKSILRKVNEEGEDVHNALLEYRNMPLAGLKVSPAELLMSRKLRTKLPIATNLLKPKVQKVTIALRNKQQSQKMYYDRGARKRIKFKLDDKVVVRDKKECVIHMDNEYDSEEQPLSSSDNVTVRPFGVNEGRALVTTKSGRVVRKPSRLGIA